MKQMQIPEIIKHTVDQALKKLQVSGCAYKVVLGDGTIFTHKEEIFATKNGTRSRDGLPYKYGDVKAHYEQYIKDLEIGGVASVPATSKLALDVIQGSLTAHLSQRWGRGNYTTFTNKETDCVEVLRIG
jgi:hypothetical protein